MTRFFTLVLSLFLAASLASLAWCKESKKPLKVIAPDLIVESFDFGEFPDGPKDQPASKERFHSTSLTHGGFIGYRIKLKTDRKTVKLSHKIGSFRGSGPESAMKHKTDAIVPIDNGVICNKWVITAGYPRGKYWVKVWLEGKALPAVSYTIK